ncbi:hypothetical protein [Halapricum desulfuricans]|uniref:hypothetical protein n=1 Tax=Halapricum desulfuricans TaxID=2841257 RepID=UPI001E2F50D8|nr:hypothetical protein [Halapricum desulfuricans]
MTSPDPFQKALFELPSSAIPPGTFFAVTFLLSWGIWIPLVLAQFGVGPVLIPEEIIGVVRLLEVITRNGGIT